jgi:hypothetical protein
VRDVVHPSPLVDLLSTGLTPTPAEDRGRKIDLIGPAISEIEAAEAQTEAPHELEGNAEAPAAEVPPDCALWLVSTRGLPGEWCATDEPPPDPVVLKCEPGAGWVESSVAEFTATDDPQTNTVVWVHGNDTEASEARAHGRTMFRILCCDPCRDAPLRFVIWSWPADRIERRLRYDLQLKACRTRIEGFYLAHFVAQIDPQCPMGLSGYSYGTRVVSGSLHVLAGGDLLGLQLATPAVPRTAPTRSVLLASAMPYCWLLPGEFHERALDAADRMLVTYNPADPVLFFYPRLWGKGGPQALGLEGTPEGRLDPATADRLVQANVRRAVDHGHSWKHYISSSEIVRRLRYELLRSPVVDTASASARATTAAPTAR